jgi:hypothetical protein
MAETMTPTTRHEYNVTTTGRSEIVDDLPDDPDVIEASTVTLLFIPKVWNNDYCRRTDDDPHRFTIPLGELRADADADNDWLIEGHTSNHHASDQFKTHDNNAERYQSWTGPFDIKIVAVEIAENMAETDATTRHEYHPFATGRSELVDDFPDDPDVIEASTVTLVFVPEAWIDGYAKRTDDNDHRFTIPLSELRADADADSEWLIDGRYKTHYVSDQFKTHEKNADRYQTWTGPFDIKVVAVEIPEQTPAER